MSVETEAIDILGRMAEVVENDMLTRGLYISSRVVKPLLAATGAVCGGRQACAVGSLWLAGGIEPHPNGAGHGMYLPGADRFERSAFLDNEPALRAAYDAMNAVCQEYIDANGFGFHLNTNFLGAMEQLFEATRETGSGEVPLINARKVFPLLIKRAQQKLLDR